MENKGFSKKIIATIVVIAVIVGAYFMLKKPAKATIVGTVEIEVVDINGKQISDKSIGYEKGDTLVSLVEANFENVSIEDGFLYTIETLTTPEDWSTYICIYVNDEMSQVGINEIELTDGAVISFVDTELSYE